MNSTVAFDNSSMLGANFQQRIRKFLSAESLHWVSTMKGERMTLCQGVPHLFKFKSSLRAAFCPQQSNHLTESYDAPIFVSCALSRTRDERTDDFLKPHRIGPLSYHELRHHFRRVQSKISVFRFRFAY